MKTKTFSTGWLIISLLLVALCGAIGSAKVIYVDAYATGGNNGSNWTNAYNYLQDAIEAATFGNEIRVAQGIYRPDQGGGNILGDRLATFQLKNGVTIKGGYAGSKGSDPNERDVDLYKSILSGDLDGDDKKTITDLSELGYDSTRNENSLNVVTGSSTNSTAVLDGFTITGGNAYLYDSGAGMYNEAGSPTINNCSFVANSAYYGGGMCNKFESKPKVSDCYFAGNYASWGGGMANVSDSDPQVDGCEFEGNGALEGAGMANISGSSPEVLNSMFRKNSAGIFGGGIQNDRAISPRIENCTFKQNSAVSSGGGIKCDNETDVEIIDCSFSGNTARYGAGISCSGESESITINCIFTGNIGSENSGGFNNTGGSESELYNCLFSGNTARFGGVIYNVSSTIRLTNCTMAGNSASSGRGNAFSCRATDGTGVVNVYNSIIWNGGYEIETWGNGDTHFVITYTNIIAWSGTGNVDLNPLFVRYPDDGGDGWGDDSTTPDVDESENDDFGDLHLQKISPCINSGKNSFVPYWLDSDLDGRPRIISSTVDRGAYEYEEPGPEPPQYAPVADAGDDQTVYAWVDEIAQVTLDGSKSSDLDGDELTYTWIWTIDEEDFEATGVSPKIDLPVGEHIIQLIVNDGIEDSLPDFVTITVIEPIKTFLSVFPQPIVRSSSAMPYIYTLLTLDDIPTGDIDESQPILLYPGAAEPVALYINPDPTGDGTTIFAIYNKQDLLDALPEDGKYDLKVVGKLKSGPYFYGFYPVRIIE